MRALLTVGVAGLLLSAAPATSGQSEWYVGIEGGVELGDGAQYGSPDLGVALIGTIGTKLDADFAIEAEIAYRSTTEGTYYFGDADVSQRSWMLNAVYELPLGDTASLTLGAGVGVNEVEWDYPFFSEGDTNFAAQIKLGLAFEISERMDIVSNVRYMTPVASSNGASDIDNATITIGLRIDL